MDQLALLALIESVRQKQEDLQAEFGLLVEAISRLNEDNNRLTITNLQLQDQLSRSTALMLNNDDKTSSSTSEHSMFQEHQMESGKDRLQGFYDDGIHVCHELFGKRRDDNEDCLFCQAVIMRLEQAHDD